MNFELISILVGYLVICATMYYLSEKLFKNVR